MRSSQHTVYDDGASVTESDFIACGGGKRCPVGDSPVYGLTYTVRGMTRCSACAERLGWIPSGSSFEQRRAFRWAHQGTRPAWVGSVVHTEYGTAYGHDPDCGVEGDPCEECTLELLHD
jgi:hypothetical protein